jgi:hypothetical protein
MKLNEILNDKIYEDLQLVRFKYSNYKQDPKPKVKVLDFQYPGQPHQKTYGQRDDLLGFNLNYFKNKKYAAKAIDDIDGFARLLSANNKEKWKRLKYFYPEVLKYIRRYNRKHINGIKQKKTFFWKSTTYDKLEKDNREMF